MILDELLDHIESQIGLVVGTELFKGVIPITYREGSAISITGGSENDTLLQGLVINCISQYNDYSTSEEKNWQIFELLSHNNGAELASETLYNCEPLKVPGYITVTDDGKFIHSFSMVLYTQR